MRRFNQSFRRKSSTVHYQTFPKSTPPPKSRGNPLAEVSPAENSPKNPKNRPDLGSPDGRQESSPLPVKQLCILAIISLSEQTALNSIGPYLPRMTASFPGAKPDQVGLYVGTTASAFALAQFTTNFFWGWLSDRIGRKPVILTGTLLTAVCFVGFGFVQTFWQAVVVQALMGFVNGNQGIVSTCLGEITDRSNQNRAFIYLPVIYGIGGITGPIVGGTLVDSNAAFSSDTPRPYIRPNLVSAVILLFDLIISMFFLEESLEQARELPPLGKRMGSIFAWVWQLASSSRPSYLGLYHRSNEQAFASADGTADSDDDWASDDSDTHSASQASLPNLIPRTHSDLSEAHICSRDTALLLVTYLLFQLSNVSYNSLYPIFGEARPPRGRNLSPEEVGLSLAFAGAATIVFQLGVFGKLRDKMGNKMTYRIGQACMACAFVLTPWIGYKNIENGDGGISNGKTWLWVELGLVLLLKSLAAVGCLTSFLLLLTNSAPNHSVLGSLNGLAQTLSAAGRAAGPFLSGSLFSLTTHVEPKGEAVAFGVFGAISFVGFVLSFGIRGQELEAEGLDDDGSEDSDDEHD